MNSTVFIKVKTTKTKDDVIINISNILYIEPASETACNIHFANGYYVEVNATFKDIEGSLYKLHD